MQNSPIQEQDRVGILDLNTANMTQPELYDGAEPNHPRFLAAGYGGQCQSILHCDGMMDCCYDAHASSSFGRCYPVCKSVYQNQCSSNHACSAGLICCNGSCVHPQASTNSCANPQQQLAILTKELKHQYHTTQNYQPTNAAAVRAREYELHQQASLLQQIETSQKGEIDYAYVQAKLQEIEREKIRLELEQQKKTVEQEAVKQEYLNEVRAKQAEKAQEIQSLQMQQNQLGKQHEVVGRGYIPPNEGVAGYGVASGSNVKKGVYQDHVHYDNVHHDNVRINNVHRDNVYIAPTVTGAHGQGYKSAGSGNVPHGVGYNSADNFYGTLRSQVGHRASYTNLNTEESSSSDEIAGIPVGGFIGIIVGVLVLCLVACCLVRYIFFSRKWQPTDGMEMDNVDYAMGEQSDGLGSQQMSNMSPRIDHMKAANADVFTSNMSMEPKIPGQQY